MKPRCQGAGMDNDTTGEPRLPALLGCAHARRVASDRGATGVEYALIIMAVTVALVAGGALLGPRIASGFDGAAVALSGTATASASASASATPSPGASASASATPSPSASASASASSRPSAAPTPTSNGRGDLSCPRGYEVKVSRGVRTCVRD